MALLLKGVFLCANVSILYIVSCPADECTILHH